MYIEVFLLDNFIMDMIILKTASAICGMKYDTKVGIISCVLLSIYAAFAIKSEVLSGFVFKVMLCVIASVPFFVKQRKLCFVPVISMFIATLAVGGLISLFSMKVGSRVISNSYLRLLLYPLCLLLCLQRLIRCIANKRCRSSLETEITLFCDGKTFVYKAIVDTGNTLTEPLSGKPVIIVYAPELMQYAHIPLSYNDTGVAKKYIYVFCPENLCIDGVSVEGMIAPTDSNPDMKALIPYCLAKLLP